jgi:ribosomal protein S6--L-glutamate ligase
LNLVQYDVMLQRYYPAAGAADTRVLVLGGRARWAIRRQAEPGSFRSNYHRGGQAEVAATGGEAGKLAEQAAAACGLGFAGVDIIASENGPLVLEVNGSPGFQAVEEAYDADVAGEIIRYCHGLLAN